MYRLEEGGWDMNFEVFGNINYKITNNKNKKQSKGCSLKELFKKWLISKINALFN